MGVVPSTDRPDDPRMTTSPATFDQVTGYVIDTPQGAVTVNGGHRYVLAFEIADALGGTAVVDEHDGTGD